MPDAVHHFWHEHQDDLEESHSGQESHRPFFLRNSADDDHRDGDPVDQWTSLRNWRLYRTLAWDRRFTSH